MQPTHQPDWEKEMIEIFFNPITGDVWPIRPIDLSNFIKVLLSQERSKWQVEAREQIEKTERGDYELICDYVDHVDKGSTLSLPFLKEDKP